MWVETRGSGSPALVLLHGMAGTGRVWDAVVERLGGTWPGRIVVPDLSGHGRSAHRPPYSYGSMAADVAAVTGRDGDVVVAGHSLGGVVALALGSGWFGCRVTRVVAMSVKVRWSDDDLARAAAVAAKPATWFDSEAEALDRYLRVAGLSGLATGSSPVARAGIVEDGGRYRLAHDPATSDLGAPAMTGLLGASRATVLLAAGSEDPMVDPADLSALDPGAITFEGVGHHPHLEVPDVVAELLLTQV